MYHNLRVVHVFHEPTEALVLFHKVQHSNFEVASVSPSCTPGVFYEPVSSELLISSVTNSQYTVVFRLSAIFIGYDTAFVEVERFMAGVNSNSNWLLGYRRLSSSQVRNNMNVGLISTLGVYLTFKTQMVLTIVVGSCNIRNHWVVIKSKHGVVLHVVPGVDVPAETAAVVFIVRRAVDNLLLRKLWDVF